MVVAGNILAEFVRVYTDGLHKIRKGSKIQLDSHVLLFADESVHMIF